MHIVIICKQLMITYYYRITERQLKKTKPGFTIFYLLSSNYINDKMTHI